MIARFADGESYPHPSSLGIGLDDSGLSDGLPDTALRTWLGVKVVAGLVDWKLTAKCDSREKSRCLNGVEYYGVSVENKFLRRDNGGVRGEVCLWKSADRSGISDGLLESKWAVSV